MTKSTTKEISDDQKRVYTLFLTGNNSIDLMDHLWNCMNAKQKQVCIDDAKQYEKTMREDDEDFDDFVKLYEFFMERSKGEVIWS